ncbi:hypothetical protein EET67_21365 [Pseudaminobacter arsenicus]|uniref:Uncharacterized protein n=1 Tax=Borborobacter arsenicus TaxID=1851146 RepID=A0A432V0N0_9HYPH|nr:hypothetical protein [Pseudaminobacter arsenicus]RUM95757.1 hypothetical protein EET67_21365 [Pseudaminobacter arsenicus]
MHRSGIDLVFHLFQQDGTSGGAMKQRRFPVTLTAIGLLCWPLVAAAAGLEGLQGAWTMDGTDCAETFIKDGAQIRFRDRASSTTTGIIVSGSKIIGSNMSCTAGSVHQEKDHFSVLLDCSDAMMFQSMSASFRVTGQDSFERFAPGFPDMSFKYHRCQL